MKEYKKNMDNRDIVFENRKQTLVSNAAPVGDTAEASNEGDDSGDSGDSGDGVGDIVRLDEVKEELEKTDVWTERNA
jgi:hypothetical protein